jgi:hypothetical protein
MCAEVASFGTDIRDVDVVVDEEEAGVGDGVMGIRRDRSGEDTLSELVGLEAVEDVFMELIGIDDLKCLVDYRF